LLDDEYRDQQEGERSTEVGIELRLEYEDSDCQHGQQHYLERQHRAENSVFPFADAFLYCAVEPHIDYRRAEMRNAEEEDENAEFVSREDSGKEDKRDQIQQARDRLRANHRDD